MRNPFDSGYYLSAELRTFGFESIGDNVQIAKNCTIIGLGNISIGDHVRIDGGVMLMAGGGKLSLGSHIHIGAGSQLMCNGGVELQDFAGLSQGVRIYSASDDYSGESLTNPTVPREYLNVHRARVVLGRHVIVGSGSVILPGVMIGEGSAVGALCLVAKSLEPWGVYCGNPLRRAKARSRALLEMESELLGLHQAV